MKIYIDENMPPMLADGFNILQKPESFRQKINPSIEVLSIPKVYGRGIKDEDWIPLAGQENACVITQDFNIRRTNHQRALCEEHGLGMIYFRPPSKNGFQYWQMVKILVKHWPEILKTVAREAKPFSYRITSKSSSLEKMD